MGGSIGLLHQIGGVYRVVTSDGGSIGLLHQMGGSIGLLHQMGGL